MSNPTTTTAHTHNLVVKEVWRTGSGPPIPGTRVALLFSVPHSRDTEARVRNLSREVTRACRSMGHHPEFTCPSRLLHPDGGSPSSRLQIGVFLYIHPSYSTTSSMNFQPRGESYGTRIQTERQHIHVGRESLELTWSRCVRQVLHYVDLIHGSFTPVLAKATCGHRAPEMWLLLHAETVMF